jgi:FkbM family methyltransferase
MNFVHALSQPTPSAVVQGHRMFLHPPARDRYVSPVLAAGAPYEPFETEWLHNLIRPGDCVLDLGAHVGYYTLLLARLVGPYGRACAFEPDPANFALLQRNVAANGYRHVELFPQAAADRTGPARLYLSGDNAGDHRVWAPAEERPSVPIETVELDRLFGDARPPFDFVKLDVQGAEYAAARGMRGLLGRPGRRYLVTEFWPLGLRSAGSDPADYLGLLEGLGFRLYVIDEARRQLTRTSPARLLDAFDPASDAFINLLGVKQG